jgi:hypothetical protein
VRIVGKITDFVQNTFKLHRDNKIALKELILRLCRYSDTHIHSETHMKMFEDALDKEFDVKGNISQ